MRGLRAGRERGEPGVGVVGAAGRVLAALGHGRLPERGRRRGVAAGTSWWSRSSAVPVLPATVDARDLRAARPCRRRRPRPSGGAPCARSWDRSRAWSARRGRASAARASASASARRARSSTRPSPSAAPWPGRVPGRSRTSRPRGRRRSPTAFGIVLVAAPGMSGGWLKPNRSAIVDQPHGAERRRRAARRRSCRRPRTPARASRRSSRRWRCRAARRSTSSTVA